MFSYTVLQLEILWLAVSIDRRKICTSLSGNWTSSVCRLVLSLFTWPYINVGTRSHKEQYFICSLISDGDEPLKNCTEIFNTGFGNPKSQGQDFDYYIAHFIHFHPKVIACTPLVLPHIPFPQIPWLLFWLVSPPKEFSPVVKSRSPFELCVIKAVRIPSTSSSLP